MEWINRCKHCDHLREDAQGRCWCVADSPIIRVEPQDAACAEYSDGVGAPLYQQAVSHLQSAARCAHAAAVAYKSPVAANLASRIDNVLGGE